MTDAAGRLCYTGQLRVSVQQVLDILLSDAERGKLRRALVWSVVPFEQASQHLN